MKKLNNNQEKAIQQSLKVLLKTKGNDLYEQLLREADNTNDYQYICKDMALYIEDLKLELEEYTNSEKDYTASKIICRVEIALYQELEANLFLYM